MKIIASTSLLCLGIPWSDGGACPPATVVNLELKQCASFWLGDECFRCPALPGWSPLGFRFPIDCPHDYEIVELESYCTHSSTSMCCDEVTVGAHLGGDCRHVVVNHDLQECAFSHCDFLPPGWAPSTLPGQVCPLGYDFPYNYELDCDDPCFTLQTCEGCIDAGCDWASQECKSAGGYHLPEDNTTGNELTAEQICQDYVSPYEEARICNLHTDCKSCQEEGLPSSRRCLWVRDTTCTGGFGCERCEAEGVYNSVSDFCPNSGQRVIIDTCSYTQSNPCFSGSSLVYVKDKGPFAMSKLKIGDLIKVSKDSYEPVYSFGHKNPEATAEFLQITTTAYQDEAPLTISHEHMVVMVQDDVRHVVPASLLQVGDKMLHTTHGLVSVTKIIRVPAKGVYAPFTPSGYLVVNGLVVSNYIALQASEYLLVGGIRMPWSHQWLAHAFNSLHRSFYFSLGVQGETYSKSGVSIWVELPHVMARWFLGLDSFFSWILLLLIWVIVLGTVFALERLLIAPGGMFMAIMVALAYRIRSRKKGKIHLS